jgi:hypothetical protein
VFGVPKHRLRACANQRGYTGRSWLIESGATIHLKPGRFTNRANPQAQHVAPVGIERSGRGVGAG